jgi:hypothetical protein
MLACANVSSFLVNMFYASLTARVEDAVFSKDDDGSDDDAGEEGQNDEQPYSPPAAASSSRDMSQYGPESPDMTPMPTQEIDKSVMMDGDEGQTATPRDDGPAAASVTHVVSSRGPRLPPRRRLVKK